ncbi:MAG TPA: hypothetical protein DDZ96_12495 [Porphyromonadaceae bacterium]|jgi:hypothetical protein|nr:hypothetical protein [Porphyromonadaceae bacterium]HBX20644.1 hypothetical protein [Porphyromonadaceae bacterium]
MKKIYFLLITVFSLTDIMCQDFSGYLYDQDNNPVEYANIILLSKSDSTMIKGTVSDSNGYFSLSISNPEMCYAKVSSLTYKTIYIDNINNLRDTIKLDSDTQLLNEVVIIGQRKILKKGNGRIIASIENSPLSFSGSANDVLTRLPLIIENNGDLQVMGKGTPLIYINGRPIEDNSELQRLKSNEIKSIEIITTPGVEYNSSINSVIKIRTIPLKGEGFSGNFQAYGSMSKRLSEYMNASLKYRYKGFDIFFDGDVLNYKGDYIRNTEYVSINSDRYRGEAKIDRLIGHIGGGVNYIMNADHSLGLRYNLTKVPKDNDEKNSIVIENKNNEYNSFSKTKSKLYRNYLNFYYNGKVSDINIDFNADYSSGKETGNSSVVEFKEEEQLADFNYGDNYDLFASKLFLKYPIHTHTFLLGGEYSFTDRKSVQNVLPESNIDDLFSSSNKNEQQFGAVFANYDLTLGEFYTSLGLRYERTIFNYFEDNIKVAEQSKKYNELLPSITFGYEGEIWQGELSYRKYIDRPSYDDLSNKISYVAYCARWSGNPFLLPSVNSELGIQFSWNNLTIIATMERVRKQIFEVNQKYQDKQDVILIIPVNLPTYNSYAIDVSYNIQVGLWQPSFDVCIQYQDLKYGPPLISYNKPIAELLQRNSFQFKNNYSALFTIGYRTKGNFATAYTNGYTNLTASVTKSFFNKSLLLKLECKDILNRYRESISINTNGLSMIDTSKGNTRKIQFTVTYYFNKSTNRYKGKGAAIEEINRL